MGWWQMENANEEEQDGTGKGFHCDSRPSSIEVLSETTLNELTKSVKVGNWNFHMEAEARVSVSFGTISSQEVV